ncbi:MAG: circadian clock KaiB family protein [Candidatus Latescibacteria bacterium]|nr:circadian clock KaiB family protein [Candidatus Latescibacterota bacterium]
MSGTIGPYKFTLFVAGKSPNSQLAQDNLNHICSEYLRVWNCKVTIVDVQKDFQKALDYDILVTPTLIVEGPRGRSTIIGNLSQIDSVLVTLGCD